MSLPPLETALFHNFFLYLIFVPFFAWFSKIITSADELYGASLTFQAIECIHQFCDWFETFRFHCIMMTTIVRHNLCLIVLKIWFLFQSLAFLFVKPNLIKFIQEYTQSLIKASINTPSSRNSILSCKYCSKYA